MTTKTFSFDIIVDTLSERMINLDKSLEKEVKGTLNEVGEILVKSCQEVCPVDTGALQDSIKVDKVTTKEVVISAGNSKVHYAPYVHDGTSRMPPRPFIIWGFKRGRKKAMIAFRKMMIKALAKKY